MDIQDGRYFCKIVYVIADPQIYRTFESIKNCQRCDFLKIFVIPGGNATPYKFQRGDTSAPLPNRSGRYQGTTPTTWLNFNTPCKSQLKNAWPFSPTNKEGGACGVLTEKTSINIITRREVHPSLSNLTKFWSSQENTQNLQLLV